MAPYDTFYLQTGTLTESNLDLAGVCEIRGGSFTEIVTDVTTLPSDSPLIYGINTIVEFKTQSAVVMLELSINRCTVLAKKIFFSERCSLFFIELEGFLCKVHLSYVLKGCRILFKTGFVNCHGAEKVGAQNLYNL